MQKIKLLSATRAAKLKFSLDQRKRKNQHRTTAREILLESGFFARGNQSGTTMHSIAQWHLAQARMLAQQ